MVDRNMFVRGISVSLYTCVLRGCALAGSGIFGCLPSWLDAFWKGKILGTLLPKQSMIQRATNGPSFHRWHVCSGMITSFFFLFHFSDVVSVYVLDGELAEKTPSLLPWPCYRFLSTPIQPHKLK